MRAKCIAAVAAAAGRELTAAETRGIEDRVRNNLKQLARDDLAKFQAMPVPTRLDEAAKLAAKELIGEAADKKRQELNQVRVHERLTGYLDEMKAKGVDSQDALRRLLLFIPDGKGVAQTLESRIDSTYREYMGSLLPALEAAEPRLLGMLSDPHGVELVTREMFGEHTGSELAKKAAEVWKKTVDTMVDRFKALGGVLHRLEDWRFPQTHDQLRVFQAGAEKWIADVLPKLDRSRYVNDSGRLMDDGEVHGLLGEAWQSIATGGANKIQPGVNAGLPKISNRNLEHRVLHFTDATGYLDYQSNYGGRDLLGILSGHVKRQSRDIAMMEHFGPNADHEFRFWNDTGLQREASTKGEAKANSAHRELEEAYRYLAGYSEGVANPNVAKAFEFTRNVLAASRLGSAVISSIPDLGTLMLTAAHYRLPQWRIFANALRMLNPANAEDRALLHQQGLGLDGMLGEVNRYGGDTLGPGYSSRLASATIRASGLTAWTDGLRNAFASTFMHALGRLTRFDSMAAMDPFDATRLKAAGIDERAFSIWKMAEQRETAFGKLLTPEGIYRIPDEQLAAVKLLPDEVHFTPADLRRDAAQKLLGMLVTESHMAITEPGASDRLTMASGRPRGELKGELLKSFWQFKSFPWTMIRRHLVERGIQGHDTAGGRVKYIGGLVLSTTLLGAAALEIDDMLRGRDPRPLFGDNGKAVFRNWVAAFAKGGALGIYGDFLASESQPGGQGFFQTAAGPLAGTLSDAGALTLGNAVQAFGNKPTNFGAEAVKFLKGVTPGANLWYAKAALDHLLFNQLQESLNPGYLARIAPRMQSQYGITHWWDPRAATPARPPELATVTGN